MPTILVKIPKDAYPIDARKKLVYNIIEAAKQAEQMPSNPKNLYVAWVIIEEIDPGMWSCGGIDMSTQLLTCFAMVNVPSGVLDATSRALYVKLIHDAFKQAQPTDDKRQIASSVILNDVIDGTWGGSGAILTLPMLAKVSGYAHLQHLVSKE